jgi:heat shock protein HtpX
MGSSRQRWSLPLSCQNRLAGPTREGGTFGLRLGVWNCCAGFSPKFIACYAQRLDTLATRPMKTVAIAIMTMVLLLVAGYLLGAALGLIFGLVSTAATKVLYLWNDDKFAPQRRGGRRVQEQDAPELVATLRDLAQRAGIPVPNLYVIESPTKANALAAGRGRRHAAICVTTGLLAHELGHVLRRSAVIKTTAAVLGAAVSLLPPFGIFFGLGIGVSLLLMFVIPPAAVLLQLAIARADEYAADEYGARLTGRPDVVAGLLGRIALVDDAGSEDMANSATGRTMLAIGRRIVGPRRDNPFSAYPLPANRAVELARLAHEMGLAAGGPHKP